MMGKLRSYLKAWTIAARIDRRVAKLTRRLHRMENQLATKQETFSSSERAYRRQFKMIQQGIEDVSGAIDEVRTQLTELKSMQEQYEIELDGERSRRKVLENSTIPALVAANKLALERYDADTSVQVRRQMVAVPEDR